MLKIISKSFICIDVLYVDISGYISYLLDLYHSYFFIFDYQIIIVKILITTTKEKAEPISAP
jgi:hypothetical protein